MDFLLREILEISYNIFIFVSLKKEFRKNNSCVMSKSVLKWISLFSIVLIMSACKAPEKVLYLQDLNQQLEQTLSQSFNVKIQKDDLLQINIFADNPEVTKPFNLIAQLSSMGTNVSNSDESAYLVDMNGCIELPILGKISVLGLTTQEVKNLIEKRLQKSNLIKNPVITVRILNFKVSVLGEVQRPGVINVKGERITILEALSEAGDLTIQGRRDHVAVIREVNGKRTVNYLDLKSKDIFESPYYYLKQNDVVYVEPNNGKTAQYRNNQVNNVGVWLSVLSSMMSVITLIVTLK